LYPGFFSLAPVNEKDWVLSVGYGEFSLLRLDSVVQKDAS